MNHEDRTKSDGMRAAQEAMRQVLPRRFYREAKVADVEGGFGVALDGRPLRTPGKALLGMPVRAVAQAVADEWQSQGEHIDPLAMPLTRLVNVVIDQVRSERVEIVQQIVAYGGTDLLYYRADSPEGLVALQSQHWDPVLAWAEKAYGLTTILAEGVMYVDQPDDNAGILRDLCGPLDDYRLGALIAMTNLTGSALLAFAVHFGVIDPEAAWTAAHVDEDWQISQWGEDAEAAARREQRRQEHAAAARLLKLMGDPA
jgi:chaperone required for assembly of F1-ATPase